MGEEEGDGKDGRGGRRDGNVGSGGREVRVGRGWKGRASVQSSTNAPPQHTTHPPRHTATAPSQPIPPQHTPLQHNPLLQITTPRISIPLNAITTHTTTTSTIINDTTTYNTRCQPAIITFYLQYHLAALLIRQCLAFIFLLMEAAKGGMEPGRLLVGKVRLFVKNLGT
ncbi:hypothetical protein Pmani_037451 [Petrolisthes manimaculis]|uniref:Uncharacterized protein n=1 Tax=Petrolisthes manimaculis TaxID=1843537 RepID=A0AAE1NJ36_9EUCA|nr:hypothetical protein Pmani_037451 [Petrolisthes manimaculis]